MKRALFGGTFDPPHLAHTRLAELAVAEVGLDEVIFLPCRQSPHKDGFPQAADGHRLAMLHLATLGLPWAQVSDWELRRDQRSFSWETAEHFASTAPRDPLFWILGVDQWQSLEKWTHPLRLRQLLTFIVLGRNGVSPQSIPGWRGIFLNGEVAGSGTMIRAILGSGGNAHDFLKEEVVEYIEQNRLYRVEK